MYLEILCCAHTHSSQCIPDTASQEWCMQGRTVVKFHVLCCPAMTLPLSARVVWLVWVLAYQGQPDHFWCMGMFELWYKEAEKANVLQTLNDEVKGYLLSQMSVPTLCSHGHFLWSALQIPVSTTHLLQGNRENSNEKVLLILHKTSLFSHKNMPRNHRQKLTVMTNDFAAVFVYIFGSLFYCS